MEFFKDIFTSLGQKSLRLGGFTFTHKKDNTLVARKSTNRKRDKKRRSGKQKESSESFRGIRRFFKGFRVVMMEFCFAWDLYAVWVREFAHTGDNCFHAINHKYMDGDEVGCPHLFRFSIGALGLPWDLEVTRENNLVLLTWHDERDCPHARGSDRVLVGIIYDDHRDRTVVFDPHAIRSHGSASVKLNPRYGTRAHIYVFFERADKSACSDDQYFMV